MGAEVPRNAVRRSREGNYFASHPGHRGPARDRNAPRGRRRRPEEGALRLRDGRRLGRRGRGHLQPDGHPVAQYARQRLGESRRRRPAVAGTDYDFTNPGTVTFAAGETRKTFPVTIPDDNVFNHPNKKIVFTLSGGPARSQIKNSPQTLTILDNDGPGTIDLRQNAYSVVESAGAATITVNRNGNPLLAESVQYAASGGAATAGSDYTATSGTVTFGVGEMSKTFQVPITDDQAFEGDEALNVTLSNPQNLTNPVDIQILGPNSQAALTIVDDDCRRSRSAAPPTAPARATASRRSPSTAAERPMCRWT